MRSRGLTGVTTRQISKAVGCSEGALYVHFEGRLELFLAMLEESLPDMLGPLQRLRESVGKDSPRRNLAIALQGIFSFHRRVLPVTCGLFAEPELLDAYRQSLARQGKGPHLSMCAIAEYIVAEQKIGRIASDANPELTAYLLMSSSFFRAFMELFSHRPSQPWDKFAKRLIETVVSDTHQLAASVRRPRRGQTS
jgi:AcrR family transcriptional regulator